MLAKASAVSTITILTYIASKGKSADMMKDSSKRKRTRQEMEDVREMEKDLKDDRQHFLQRTKKLREERDQMETKMIELEQSEVVLRKLYKQGVVDEHGNAIAQSS
jgi:hypothetical protein